MEKIFEQAMLYDFYGELLKDHPKQIFEAYVLDNYSLAEIAEEEGISRQAVFDIVKRAGKALEGYESKLHLVQKFLSIRDKVGSINELSKDMLQGPNSEQAEKIIAMSTEILDEL